MSRYTKKQDAIRLRTIMQLLVEPFDELDEPGVEPPDDHTKLYYALHPDPFPIYRRKILKSVMVTGLWWMHETQWLNWLWQGHSGHITKHGSELDRVLAHRSLLGNGWAYIREGGDRIDIEAQTMTSKWDAEKKKRMGAVREWVTVSVTPTEFKKIDIAFGPRDDGCNHEDYHALFQG